MCQWRYELNFQDNKILSKFHLRFSFVAHMPALAFFLESKGSRIKQAYGTSICPHKKCRQVLGKWTLFSKASIDCPYVCSGIAEPISSWKYLLTATCSIKTFCLKQIFTCTCNYPKLFDYHKAVLKLPVYHAVCLWLKNNDSQRPLVSLSSYQ